MKQPHLNDLRWSRPAVVIDANERRSDALLLMQTEHTYHLVVTHNGQIKGVISDRDLDALGTSRHGADAMADPLVASLLPASTELRDEAAPTLNEDSDLQDALLLMHRHGVSALPLLRNGQLVGLITESDVLRLITATLAQQPLEPAAKGQVLLANPLVQNLMNLLAEAGI